LEKLGKLNYLNMVYKECLRIDSIVPSSSFYTAKRDATVGPYKIKKGLTVATGVISLHNDSTAWITPREFIPERFDPESKYFLTPNGLKRDPFQYQPFHSGGRNCIGQNLAMAEGKIVCALIALSFDFELIEKIKNLKDISWAFSSDTELKVKVTKVY
jgi:cytochrome P450